MPAHSETKILPYSADQMYALVADVASYPEFIPWTTAARVRSVRSEGEAEIMMADLVVGFRMFREKFLSQVTLWPGQKKIDTEYIDGPFKHMISNWAFEDVEDGCAISFQVDFEFRNKILQGAAGMFFHDAMTRIVKAFETRAGLLYGPTA